MTVTHKTSDLVVLLPGFLGFDRIGSFYYFGDRLGALLRGHLEGQLDGSVPVIPLALGPARGLLVRQQCIVEAGLLLLERFPGLERIHLVGHSAGGVDAELLLADKRVDGSPWPAKVRPLRERIASVASIGSPHYGTTLALADVTRLLEQPARNASFLGALLPAAVALLKTLPDRASTKSQLLGDAGSLRAFLRELWRDRELLRDLIPEHMENLRKQLPRERRFSHIPLTCYATAAIPNPAPTTERFEQPDPLFLYLLNQTAGAHVDRVSPEVQENIQRLNAAGVPVIASPAGGERPRRVFDEIDNDAVVNTARQLLPHARLGAIVHADHADVIGHYDRRDPLHPERFIREGIFRSGARFGDDEFFALYRSVAVEISALAAKSVWPKLTAADAVLRNAAGS